MTMGLLPIRCCMGVGRFASDITVQAEKGFFTAAAEVGPAA